MRKFDRHPSAYFLKNRVYFVHEARSLTVCSRIFETEYIVNFSIFVHFLLSLQIRGYLIARMYNRAYSTQSDRSSLGLLKEKGLMTICLCIDYAFQLAWTLTSRTYVRMYARVMSPPPCYKSFGQRYVHNGTGSFSYRRFRKHEATPFTNEKTL